MSKKDNEKIGPEYIPATPIPANVDGSHLRNVCNGLGLNPFEAIAHIAMDPAASVGDRLRANFKLADYLLLACNGDHQKQAPYMIFTKHEEGRKMLEDLEILKAKDKSEEGSNED